MSLIASISGIRGTIGGKPGNNLTPMEICKFTSAFILAISENELTNMTKNIIVGYDGRPSKSFILPVVSGTLQALGYNPVIIGLTTTPTMEMFIPHYKADGGIMISASHNPINWNALKLFNDKGEFISPEIAEKVINYYNNNKFPEFANINNIGKEIKIPEENVINYHIEEILKLELVLQDKIKEKNFNIVVDGINSSGAIYVPKLLEKLGVKNFTIINSEIGTTFAHNPEPLPENLTQIIQLVKEKNADVGIVVDPDVDRLAFITEKGEPFGEEYTLVAIADYVLSKTPGPTVSNLSSTQALRIITEKYGQKYYASPVGEINVVNKMKEVNAVIGGEGNGGVIYPKLHYGRDALVGIALMLSFLAETNLTLSQLKNKYPNFTIIKDKISIEGKNINKILKDLAENPPFDNVSIDTQDGVKLIFSDRWIHIRKSNTEPIIRIYAEAENPEIARTLIEKIKKYI